VNEHGGVTTIIDDHVRPVTARPGQHLLRAPPVLLQRLSLPSEDARGAPAFLI
jgi:hypothetical protein